MVRSRNCLRSPTASSKPARGDRLKLIVIAFLFNLPYQAVRAARDAGYEVHVLGKDTARGFKYSLACSGYRDFAYRPGRDSLDAAAEEISRYIRDVGASAVLPGDVVSTRLLIAIRDRLPVPSCLLPEAQTFDMFNDKWLFYQFCRLTGVRVPDTRIVDSPARVARAVEDGTLTLPLVVKPVIGMAGSGVRILRHNGDLGDIYCNGDAPLLVQSFIEGRDRDISVVANRGTITAYAVQFRKHRRFDFADSDQLRDMAKRLVTTSGFEGVAHFDGIEQDGTGDIYLLECNPRFWFTMFALIGAGMNVVTLCMAGNSSSADAPITVTRPIVPVGRCVIRDFLSLSWSPALFSMLRYYLADLPGVVCHRRHMFADDKPGPGDIRDQLTQLASLTRDARRAATPADARRIATTAI
jgi:hypothetical protein